MSRRAARAGLSRRSLLRGLGAAALALPLLPELHAHAAEGLYPKRVVFFFVPDGVQPSHWFPSVVRSPTDYELSATSSLQPLMKHRAQLSLINGLQHRSSFSRTDNLHDYVMQHVLTGGLDAPAVTASGLTTPAGASIDQVLAAHLGAPTPFKSYLFGVRADTNTAVQRTLCFNARGQGRQAVSNPLVVLQELFNGQWPAGTFTPNDIGNVTAPTFRECSPYELNPPGTVTGGTSSTPPPPPERPWRRGVLDRLLSDYSRVRCELGREGRDKLDAHLEGLRQVERQLGVGTPPPSPGGGLPALDGCYLALLRKDRNYANYGEWIDNVSRLQLDLVTGALATDATRVAVVQYGASTSPFEFRFLAELPPEHRTTVHHSLAHLQADASTDAQRAAYKESIRHISTWYASQLGYLLDNLAAVREGDGTLLDNTVVLFHSDMMYGANHDRFNLPVVVAGGAGGALRKGLALNFASGGGRPFTDLLVTVAKAAGVDLPSFGQRDVTNAFDGGRTTPGFTGPITELLA